MKKRGRMTKLALKSLFQKPATISYMGGKLSLEKHVRGLLAYDRTTCIDCNICMKDCPTGAIRIVNNGTKTERDMHAFLDTGRCVFCCQCVDSCPKKSLSCTTKADLSQLDRGDLTIEL